MDQIKTRFIIAVTNKLSAAEDTTAKIELIEELSENLYSRYADMVSNGMSSGEAYQKALGELGDTDELLAYLASLGPDGEIPYQDRGNKDFTEDLRRNVEQVVRDAVSQTKDAVDQATIIVRNLVDKFKEKYPNGFKSEATIHFDGGNVNASEKANDVVIDLDDVDAAGGDKAKHDKGWSFTAGYDKDRGGFFCENGQSRRVTGTEIPSQGLSEIDIHVNGDVTVNLSSDLESDVLLGGDVERLETRVSNGNLLSIRQGNTASSSFFFHRGLDSANVELTIPQRHWDKLRISTVNGDVDLDAGLDVGKLSVKLANGDASVSGLHCEQFSFKSASGDLDCHDVTGDMQAETASGDMSIQGRFGTVQVITASGDVEISGGAREIRCSSASGDLEVVTDCLPDTLNISSKSGDCGLTMPEDGGFTLHYSTVSGDLDSEFSLVGQLNARSGEAMYLDGGGRDYHISSVSGDINLRKI